MLWLTGLFFLTNAAHAATRGYTAYAAAFVALAVTSFFFHRADDNDRQVIFWLDQLALWCVILIGAYYWQGLRLVDKWVPAACLFGVGALWYGGFITESFVFSKQEALSRPSHGIMHLLSSIGHHAILVGL
jgi:hypothetical protein